MHHRFIAACLLAAACHDPGEPGLLVPKTVDDDPSLPYIDIADTRIHSEAIGDPDAPMIVVLHGGPGGDYEYLRPMSALADDGYRIVFWDQRGAGLSRRYAGGSYSQAAYLEDLRLVIDHYTTSSTQPIVFLGQSWGAMYATMFVNELGDYGGRVAGAVLTEPGAFTSTGLEAYMKGLIPPWGVTSEELNDLVWTDQLMSASDHERADYLQLIAVIAGIPSEHADPSNPEPFSRKGAVVNARLLDLALTEGFDWTTHLGEFAHPVLFLRGDLNENMPLAHQQELASHYANASMITVTGVGHAGIWERSDEYLEHIRAYLAGLEITP